MCTFNFKDPTATIREGEYSTPLAALRTVRGENPIVNIRRSSSAAEKAKRDRRTKERVDGSEQNAKSIELNAGQQDRNIGHVVKLKKTASFFKYYNNNVII